MGATLPGERGRLTVSRGLRDPSLHGDTLEAVGLKVINDRLFIEPDLATQKLLDNTHWRWVDVGSVLARLPGATRAQQRIGHGRRRGVSLPLSLLM